MLSFRGFYQGFYGYLNGPLMYRYKTWLDASACAVYTSPLLYLWTVQVSPGPFVVWGTECLHW